MWWWWYWRWWWFDDDNYDDDDDDDADWLSDWCIQSIHTVLISYTIEL